LEAKVGVDSSAVATSLDYKVARKSSLALDNLASVAINTTLVSDTDNTDALGTAAISWSDLFLGSGAVITWSTAPNTADITLTHSANALTLAGGDLIMDTSLGSTGTRVLKGWMTNLEITNLPTINGGTLATALSLSSYAPVASPTFTGTVTLPKTLEIQDTSADHQYVLAVNELTADRTVTLPLLTGNDEFVFKAHIQTLTNKRTNPRLVTAASYTTDTGTSLDISTCDQFEITAQAGALLFNSPGGTPVGGNKLTIRIKDDGTARALTWNEIFRALGTALPSTTVLSKTLYLGFIYNATDTKWDLVAAAQEA
jgi:hypothetical protein